MEGDEGGDEAGEELEVWSWGAGTDGQLGTGRLEDEHVPRHLSLSSPSISLLACGGAHVIALTCDGRAYSWGRGNSGQLGHGEVVTHCLTPKAVAFSDDALFITSASAGWSHSSFLSDGGCLFTCGDGSFGQLGHGDHNSHCSPAQVSYLASEHVHQVACGLRHTLALSKGGGSSRLYGFGSCKRGQLGPNSEGARSVSLPQVVQGLEGVQVKSVSANGDHSAALSTEGRVYTWGRGFPGAPDAHSPEELQFSVGIKQIALGWNHALLLTDLGEVFIIGGNRLGLLSNPEKMRLANHNHVSPEKVAGFDEKVIQIAVGAEHSVLVTEDGSIKTWGWGEHGQLGLRSTCDQMLPQEVSLSSRILKSQANHSVYCGSGFTFAIRSPTKSRLGSDN